MDLDDYKCAACGDFCIDAVEEAKCGALMCEACAEPLQACPTCGAVLNEPPAPNRPIRRIIGKLTIPCPNDGCEEAIPVPQRQDHQALCGYVVLECPFGGCDNRAQRREMDAHKSACPHRPHACGCGMTFPYHRRAVHVATVCPVESVECPGCATSFDRRVLRQHLDTCSKRTRLCDFAPAGCEFIGAPVQLSAHLEIAREEHNSMALRVLNDTLGEACLRLQCEVARLRSEALGMATLQWDVEDLRVLCRLTAHQKPVTALGLVDGACKWGRAVLAAGCRDAWLTLAWSALQPTWSPPPSRATLSYGTPTLQGAGACAAPWKVWATSARVCAPAPGLLRSLGSRTAHCGCLTCAMSLCRCRSVVRLVRDPCTPAALTVS